MKDLTIFGKGLWKAFGLEKPKKVQSLMSYCGNLEDNIGYSADEGGLACEGQREV